MRKVPIPMLLGPRWVENSIQRFGHAVRLGTMTTNEKDQKIFQLDHRQVKRRRVALKTHTVRERLERLAHRTERYQEKLPQVVDVSRIVHADIRPNPLLAKRTIRQKYRKRFTMGALHRAVALVENERDKVPLFVHFVRRAFINDHVLVSLMSKLLPDLKSMDAKITQQSPYKLIIDVGQPCLPPGNEE